MEVIVIICWHNVVFYGVIVIAAVFEKLKDSLRISCS